MYFFNRFTLFLGFFSLSSLLFAQKEGTIRILCKLRHQEDSVVTFGVQTGCFEAKDLETVARLDSNHVTHFSFPSTTSTVIKVRYDYRTFELYCEPNDSIYMDFDAEIYPTDIFFSGTPTAVANNTLLHALRTEFVQPSNKYLTSQIYTKSNMEFRKIMDNAWQQKWNFYHQYLKKNRPNVSAAFFNFVQAEINYWYAYYLMRYRDEHLSLVSAEYIYMSDAYFDFLNETIINDDKAFIHLNYINFLKSYGNFRRQNPSFPHGIAARQVFVQAKTDTLSLFSTVNCSTLIATTQKNNRLLVLDKMTYQEKDKNIPVALRLKVKTQDGLVGWVKTNAVVFEPMATKINSTPLYIRDIENDEMKDLIDCMTIADSAGYYLDPNDSGPFMALKKKERLAMLNEETTESIGYVITKGKRYWSYLSKTRNKYGTIGWIPASGIQIHYYKAPVNEFAFKVSENSKSNFEYFDYYFHGKALYFVYGLYLKEKLLFNGKNSVKKEIEQFTKSEHTLLNQEMQGIYENLDKKYTYDSTLLTLIETTLDQRESSLNLNTLPFTLLGDENNPIIDAKAVLVSNNSSDKTEPSFRLTEPSFPDVKYEFKPILLKGTKKMLSKNSIDVWSQPDILNKYFRKQSYIIVKGAKFWQPDTFVYKINAIEPIWSNVALNGDTTRCYFEPGQVYSIVEEKGKLKITTKTINLLPAIKELTALYATQETLIKNRYALAPEAFKKEIYQLYTLRKDTLKSIKTENKATRNYVELQNSDADYWLYNHLFRYAEGKDSTTLYKIDYFDFMREIRIQNDRALLSSEYQQFISLFLAREAKNNLHLPIEEMARLTYSTKVLKYWQARQIIQTLQFNFDSHALNKIQFFNHDNSYPILMESIRNVFVEEKIKREGYALPNFVVQNRKKNTFKNNDFQNKVILIHFWSYNDPTYAKRFRELAKMEKALKSDFFFDVLYINTDTDYLKWRKATRKFRRDPNQVFINENNTYSKSFIEYFDAQKQETNGLLVDKKGNLTSKLDLTKLSIPEVTEKVKAALGRKN